MSAPQSGIWIGMFLFDQTGKAFPLTLNLTVQDGGPIAGTFTVTVPAGAGWAGPMTGDLKGSYLPTLHMAQTSDEGNATFTGKFEVPDPDHGIMWGTVTISKIGNQDQKGIMALVYTARSGTPLPQDEPTGAFSSRIWDP